MRKSVTGFKCKNCGVLFCDRIRSDRLRKFCSKSCSSKFKWRNNRSKMLDCLSNKKSFVFKEAEFKCEHCNKTQIKRSAKHRWCDDCVRPAYFKKDRSLLVKYGISWREYEKMLRDQNGKCSICLETPKTYNVDHCHKTKKVRGVLCSRCNGVLEFIEDSPRLFRALQYLGSV